MPRYHAQVVPARNCDMMGVYEVLNPTFHFLDSLGNIIGPNQAAMTSSRPSA